MRYKLRLLKPVKVTDGLGSQKPKYVEQAVVHAERVQMRDTPRDEVGEHFSGYTTEWRIRDAHEVDEDWQVEQLGGHLYIVVGVIPNRERGMLTLRCRRLNQ